MKNRGMKRNSGYIGWRQRSKWKNQTSHSLNYRHINALTVSNTYPAISILAPAKGATGFTAWATRYFTVSIHAPTKGATTRQPGTDSVSSVSIHAPTKGATNGFWYAPDNISRFNPRSYERSDTGLTNIGDFCIAFQSTLLRKERQQFYTNHHLILFYF